MPGLRILYEVPQSFHNKHIGLNNSKYIDILDQEFTLNEITDAIKGVKHNKSHGNDQIINEMFKSAESSVSPLILKLFICILKSEYFPEQWAVGY